MLLTIDAGNTQTVFGLYERAAHPVKGAGEGLVDHWRLSTDADRTHDEYAVLLRNFLDTIGYDMDAEVTGVAICSGVPRVLANLRQMVQRYFEFEPVVIEPGVKTGMPIHYDNPKEVGADRIAKGEFVGGAIAPGIEISLDALFGRAAALRAVELVEPRNVIGKSTVESIQSGAVYGFVGLVDGMVERFRKELGQCTVVSTGGLAHLLSAVSDTIQHTEPFLTLHGLRLVHEKNVT
jgi:type III pantothenate kinase